MNALIKTANDILGYDITDSGLFFMGKIELGKYKSYKSYNAVDLLIGGESLFDGLQQFFEDDCKKYWDEFWNTEFTFAVQHIITDPNYKFYLGGGISEWIGGNKGFEYVMKNNDEIFEIFSKHTNNHLIFKI